MEFSEILSNAGILQPEHGTLLNGSLIWILLPLDSLKTMQYLANEKCSTQMAHVKIERQQLRAHMVQTSFTSGDFCVPGSMTWRRRVTCMLITSSGGKNLTWLASSMISTSMNETCSSRSTPKDTTRQIRW